MLFSEVKIEIPEKINLNDSIGVIDLQPTFMEGGELAVAGGKAIIPVIENLVEKFTLGEAYFWACEDSHEIGSVSLVSSYENQSPFSVITLEEFLNGKVEISSKAKFNQESLKKYLTAVKSQVLWPEHAITGTVNGFVIPSIRNHKKLSSLIRKGFNISEELGLAPDSYSAARMNNGDPTGLISLLNERNIKRIFLCGLAGDYCVGSTAKDLLESGFEVWVITNAQACVAEESERNMVDDLIKLECKFTTSINVLKN